LRLQKENFLSAITVSQFQTTIQTVTWIIIRGPSKNKEIDLNNFSSILEMATTSKNEAWKSYPSQREEHKGSKYTVSRPTYLFFKSRLATEKQVHDVMTKAIISFYDLDGLSKNELEKELKKTMYRFWINVSVDGKDPKYPLIGRTYIKVADEEFGLALLGEVQVPPEETEEYAQIQAERLAYEEDQRKKKEQAKLDAEFPQAKKTWEEIRKEVTNTKMSWADMDEEEEEERNRFRDPEKIYYPAVKLDRIDFSPDILKEYNVDASDERNTYIIPDIMRAVAKPIEVDRFDRRKLCVKKLPMDFFDQGSVVQPKKMAALYCCAL
jgi:hypothetical protein